MAVASPSDEDHLKRRSNRGVTLAESLLVVTVMLVMGAVTLPHLLGMLQLRRLESASADWTRVLQSARHWSFTLNTPVRLEVKTTSPACLLLHTGARDGCSGCVTPACHGDAKLLASTALLPTDLSASSNSVSLAWNPADRTVTPTGTIKLELPDGRAIHHVVNLAGRLRTCSPSGLVWGITPC